MSKRLVLVPVLLALAWVSGFLLFVRQLDCIAPGPEQKTDGIAVLTGSANRLYAGVDVLRAGGSRRLLISGVKRGTNKQILSTAMGRAPEMFDCCIDLGEAAMDTAGNAVEIAEWVRQNNYNSLRIVTSSAHMPRSMMEVRHRLDNVVLLAHSVCQSQPVSATEGNWLGPTLLEIGEYHKFLLSFLRLRFGPQQK